MTSPDDFERFGNKLRVDNLRIADADGWVLSLCAQQMTLGAMILSASTGAEKFENIEQKHGAGYFRLLALAEELSAAVFGAQRISAVALMTQDPVIHYHIVPRYLDVVHFAAREWVDDAWLDLPRFEGEQADDGVLDEILDKYLAYMKANASGRQLKSWMAGTLAHYEHCDAVFYREFGDHLYAVGGTLLGGIRDHGFISHDKDMDVAYLSKHQEIPAVRKEFVSRLIRLLDKGERITIVDRAGKLQRRHAKWWADDGSYVDLFPACYDMQGYYSRPTFVRIPLPKEDLLPLRKIRFEGASIYVPNKTEKKIQAIFGEGWRHPDPKWKKPVFDGIQETRKAFAMPLNEVRKISEHCRYPDRMKLDDIVKDMVNKQAAASSAQQGP